MRRFFVGQAEQGQAFKGFFVGSPVTLDAQQSKHAWRVLRLTYGDRVELVDGSGRLAVGVIEILKPCMSVMVEQVTTVPALEPRLTLACAIPKGGRADDMINQLCQLGLDELIPLNTQRSVVEPKENKLNRFERIIAEASKQCGRSHALVVSPMMTLEELGQRTFDEKRIGLPGGEKLGMPDASVKNLLILIGPEGGFTPEEEQWAMDNGFKSWRFAPYILRIETAAVSCVAIMRSSV